ncbi:30S ribosomal protein S1 [candidate division KSB1 bacterium]|nr:30S ribosomal protein S1 [candidate division KSB1 bacterium]NIR72824.1 30S ribosomal protein S1 [candidate division KSB1 bacterium]NIS26864.1 30S ribosomal protein S1 [candidate division KSB1 bacterium]NIT73660.1 30S ribosomal protein S1 [candidate division KSB1 bacterium]NIU27531.1 30S ribosomal protein S1 [candidate division KSB1 bacterium]
MNGGDATEVKKQSNQVSSNEEEVYTLEELEDEKEYTEEEYNAMVDLYEQTLTDFAEGELVMGKVLGINDKEVSVDIGFKSEGTIPIDEFKDPDSLSVGDDIEVFLDDVEDNEGQLVLSKKKADFMRQWEKVLETYRNDETIEGTCMRRIKGGIVVDLMGVDAFLPGSQIDVKPIRDFDALIGQTMEFKIVKVNELRKNIVVSHRVLIEEGMKEQREQILENLERGQILEGSVKNITDFGVFIDLGGVDGLLHINDLSWGRVSHPSEVVSLDEKIKVQVLDFNEEKDRISLGLKQLQPHPWDNVKDKYKEGDVVTGKVVNISDYGTFIELEKGVEGLIHISEMSWTQHIKHPSKMVSLGETIEAKILNIDHEERKISLGLKQLEPDPWADIEAKYPENSKQTGIVRNLTNFGAFVELEEGIDGLIHISDLSWTKKIRHPGEVVKKGEEVEVVVLNIDKENRRISLGYKQTVDNPWDEFEQTYQPKASTKGKIVRMIEKGVIIELPDGVDGFVPMSQLQKEGIRKPADAYKVGDELELSVIEFNKENKKIILSEKQETDKATSDQQPGFAVDDEEAIAEYEKEVEGSGAKKKSAKAKVSGTEKEKKSETTDSKGDVKGESNSQTAEAETKAEAQGESEGESEAVEAKKKGDAEGESESESEMAEAKTEAEAAQQDEEKSSEQDSKS